MGIAVCFTVHPNGSTTGRDRSHLPEVSREGPSLRTRTQHLAQTPACWQVRYPREPRLCLRHELLVGAPMTEAENPKTTLEGPTQVQEADRDSIAETGPGVLQVRHL